MITDRDFSLLESYLDEILTGEAKTSFEDRLRNEEDLAEQLSLMVETNILLEDFDKHQKIEEWKEIIQTESISIHQTGSIRWLSNIHQNRTVQYALSLAAMLVIGVALYFILPTTSASPEQLASHYWSETAHFSYADTSRGNNSETTEQEVIQQIYNLHKTGNYTKAIDAIEKLPSTDSKMNLLKGSSYYNANKLEEAIHTFQQIADLPNHYLKEEAKWFLALSYLKKQDIENSKKELQGIVKQRLWNHALAKELLKEI